jgi:hypothetical protein
MTIWRRALILAFNVLLFGIVWMIYTPHQRVWSQASAWGNATPEVRTAVVRQLGVFQEGYTRRTTADVPAFMDKVFSREHPVALGTMPAEVYVGYDAVGELVRTDWQSWGDCRFRLDETQVSAAGDVAWFATVGSVKFDLSRFLVMPLRLSGVMVNEGGQWKIRQAQFQFDLDLSLLLLADVLLLVWLAVNAVLLCVAAYRRLTARRLPVRP